MPTDLVVFEYGGNEVIFDATQQMWNLNAMHQAAGSVRSKEPSRWLASVQARELIAALRSRSNTENSGIWEARRGQGGGTWAHWQIAAAYAHYLNPDFYLQWNEWAMAYRQGQASGGHHEARLAALEQQTAELRRRLAGLEAPPQLVAPDPTDGLAVETTAHRADRLADAYWQAGKSLTIRALAEALGLTIGGARMHFMRLRHGQAARWQTVILTGEPASRGRPCIALRPRT